MNVATALKVALPIGISVAVPAGLVIAHERVFLAGQEPELRRSRTTLTAREFAGAAGVATAVGLIATHGRSSLLRGTIAASGATFIATSLASGAWAVATSSDSTAPSPPFGKGLADAVKRLPPIAVRSGETMLAGGIIGGFGGAMLTRSAKGMFAGAGIGSVAGAAGGAAVFSLVGANR